jgi:dihydroneopterin aldolase
MPGSDRIALTAMRFDARLGVSDQEREGPQPIEVDLEMAFDLREAGRTDDLAATIDYGRVFGIVRDIVDAGEFRLLEAIADRISSEVFARTPVGAVVVRVRKLRVPVEGRLDHASVEIVRERDAGG